MIRGQRQEFCIKSVPMDDGAELEELLNSKSKAGWGVFSINETEIANKPAYSVIFVRDVLFDEDDIQDLQEYKTKMERLLDANEEPYQLCLSFQKKILDRRNKIEEIKNLLDSATENEREFLNEEIARQVDRLNSLKQQLKELLMPSNMAKQLGEERLSICLSEENYCLNDPSDLKNLLSQTIKTRQELAKELGYIIPKVQFIESEELESNMFNINVHGVPVAAGFAYPNYSAYFADELDMDEFPEGSLSDVDPCSGVPVIWIKDELTKDFWVKGLHPSEYVARCLKYFAIKHVHEIFNYSDMERYIDIVANNNEGLIDTVEDYLSINDLKFIFCSLIRERISVKDVIYVFEKISECSRDENKSSLHERIRIALSRQICWSVSSQDKKINAYELSDKLIDLLESNTIDSSESDGIIKIDGSLFDEFIQKVIRLSVESDLVIVVPQHLRSIVFALVSQLYMDVPVLGYDEIAPEFELKIEGKI